MLICPDCATVLENTLHKCSGCNWVSMIKENYTCFFSSQDMNNPMFAQYLNNYDKIGADDLQESLQNQVYLDIQSKKFFSYIGDVQNKSVCELGIGQGLLLKQLLNAGTAHIVGIDICLSYLQNIRKKYSDSKLELILANAENLPFKDHFDILAAADILEHVLNVGDFLYAVHRALKPGGKLALKVPYLEDINHYAHYKGCPYELVHLRNFSKQTLRMLVENAGFKIESMHFDGYIWGNNRKYIKRFPRLQEFIAKHVISKYESIHHVAGISNFWGSLLMRPVEVTLIATVIK